jgi:hypothetical protein
VSPKRDKTLTVYQTGIDLGGKGVFLALESYSVSSFDSVASNISGWVRPLPLRMCHQAVTYQMNFFTDAETMNDKPEKFLLELDPSKNKIASQGIGYTVDEPSFRVLLNCVN